MSLVLDTSATLAFLLDDERDSSAAKLLERVSVAGAIVPDLWLHEVANSLTTAVRRGRITSHDRHAALRGLTMLDIQIDHADLNTVWLSTVALADLYGLTIYDAAYLELAQRARVPLATLDDALVRACKASAVALAL